MPTKSKLPRNKVPPPKLAKPPEVQQTNSTSSSASSTEPPKTASGLHQEAEDQFELELCWCIQQLQAGLMDIKLQDKQVYNMTKSLNVLKSSNASLIKKRQVMRNTFGDYRSKMADDEKKFSKSTSVVKFLPANSKKLEKKSQFLKKACGTNLIENNCETVKVDEELKKKAVISPDVSNEPFKFNFSLSEQ